MDEIIKKSGSVGSLEVTENELALINQYAIKDLAQEEVFTFKVAICDNEIDRDFECFPYDALKTMATLFKGKTIISDHRASSQNQCARIFHTELTASNNTTKTDEIYTQLVAHCYMVRTDSNKDLITEISAGIKKEVSVGCRMGKTICSICGTDNRKMWCDHYNGREYDGKQCFFKLEDPKDAYEVSFVAVPAQPKAGVIKSYGAEKKEKQPDNTALECRLKLLKCFIDEKEKTHE